MEKGIGCGFKKLKLSSLVDRTACTKAQIKNILVPYFKTLSFVLCVIEGKGR